MRVYAVIAIQDHDCYEIDDIIAKSFESYAEADKFCTGHNSLYVKEIGIVSEAKTIHVCGLCSYKNPCPDCLHEAVTGHSYSSEYYY